MHLTPGVLQTMLLTALLVISAICSDPIDRKWVVSAPAGSAYTEIQQDHVTIIPNGRLLTPRGKIVMVAPHPYGLVLSPDGRMAVTANSGVRPFSLSIIHDLAEDNPTVRQIPEGWDTDEGILAAVFMGLAISPNGRTLYAGGGQEGSVILFDLESGERLGEIDANVPFAGRAYADSYIGDLVLNGDGTRLFAVDQTNFRMLIADTQRRAILASVPVGRYPFGITLTPDEKRLYVANVGMYEYSVIEGVDPDADPPRQGVSFPPFAYGSKEAEEGVESEGYRVPGLGPMDAPESFSVWGIDVATPGAARVVSRIRTGFPVGEKIEEFPTVGGSSPNSLVSTDRHVFVSNGNNDIISVIDIALDSVVTEIHLQLDERLGNLRGHIPFGLALTPDHRRLYVAEAGINAVAVVDLERFETIGHIPAGWFPSKVAVTPDGKKLVVANAKGFGSGPNGGAEFTLGPAGSYVGNLMRGFVSIFDIPDDVELHRDTRRVVENNFNFRHPNDRIFAWRQDNPIPLYPGQRQSPIEHLVFIVKENRTFDEVFGQVTGGRGDSSLARYGRGVTFTNRDGTRTVEGATIMPNHLALADRFAIGDNFYCDSDVSADGHRWLVGIYPNEWVETSVAASYGGGRNLRLPTTAPGMLAFVGASAAVYPEDYNEAGSIWDHFFRHEIDFFNFGLGFEFAPGIEEQEFKYTGIRMPINYPMPGPLFDRTSRRFATYNMSIPDQFRVDMFIEEYEERWGAAGNGLPQVLTIFLPNDHGAGERPDEGYPFNESYMADNDLALGRVVEFLSSTPHWKKMAIFVTEDDPQGGVDHVDAHRSILMVISPYARKGYVSKGHFSFGSIMKTFWHVLGTPYLNQYDAGATDLADFFSSQPDYSPYRALPPDPRVFDPQKALDPLDADFNWKALGESPGLDDVATMQRWSREHDTLRTRK